MERNNNRKIIYYHTLLYFCRAHLKDEYGRARKRAKKLRVFKREEEMRKGSKSKEK